MQGLYLSPYSGEQSERNNGGNYYLSGFNILKKLEKIQTVNYIINSNKKNQLISKNLVFRGFDYPTVDLDFSYIPDGITNEYRLNFDVGYFNYHEIYPMFSSMMKSNLFDKKDFFLVIKKNENDLSEYTFEPSEESINPKTKNNILDLNSSDYGMLHFQNCYLKEYQFEISTNNLTIVNQRYTCDNLTFYNSGSNLFNRTLDLKSGDLKIASVEIIIPRHLDLKSPNILGKNILLPQDMNIQILSSAKKIIFDTENIYSLNYNITFNRSELKSVNYKFPLLNKIQFPVQGTLNLNIINKNINTGSFFEYLNLDNNYDIICDFNSNRAGVDNTRYIFSGCKFNNINYDSSIEGNKNISILFKFDIDPDFSTRGLFASGNLINIKYDGFLLGNSGINEYELIGTESSIDYDLSWITTAPLVY
jgi:hypothetical protein